MLSQRTAAHGRTCFGAGKKCEKEGAGEKRSCSGVTTTPRFPVASEGKKRGGRDAGNEAVKLGLEKRSGAEVF